MPFTPKSRIEYEEPFTPPGAPISVIASFSRDGGVKPLYFKYDSSTYTETVKIESVKTINHLPLVGSDFSCTVLVGDRQNTVILRYMKREDRWFLLPPS
ncbi:hypothetical protein ABFO11_00005 [Anaerostipes caccae]|jgi:hypothetical protein|uniref:hypothetical protein n=1 Tax=Anaerostipes caccae TaxID=105841 RepID=UPI00033E43A3|nr:uncharacterized protein BN583_02828 [Anaerostipes sp. CAG:276]